MCVCVCIHIFQVTQWWRIHLPMQKTEETLVRSLGWKDPLEEEMATHSSLLAWRIPWTERPGGLQTMGLQRVGCDCTQTHTHMNIYVYRAWRWERLKAGGERGDRGWDGWVASPTQWTWVWARSRSWWWTGRPGVLQSVGSQRVGHDWATELNTDTQSSVVDGPHSFF